MNLKLITAAAENCVTTAEVKAQIRVTASAEDTIIARYIKAAEALAEAATGRKFITQTWEYYLHNFPSNNRISLPFPPLKTFTSLKYYDNADVLQTLVNGTDYFIDDIAVPAIILCASNSSWPSVSSTRPANNVIARFECGFGAATAVPEAVKTAVIQIAGFLFEHREDEIMVPSAVGIPFESNWLLTPYKCFTDF